MIATIAVGTDGSGTATEAVRMAGGLARRLDAKLVLLSAFQEGPPPPEPNDPTAELDWVVRDSARVREILTRTETDLRREGIHCTTRVDEGEAAEVLVRLAMECDADLLVIGNKGMHRRVLGSVPNTVTHRAPCSVLVVKTT